MQMRTLAMHMKGCTPVKFKPKLSQKNSEGSLDDVKATLFPKEEFTIFGFCFGVLGFFLYERRAEGEREEESQADCPLRVGPCAPDLSHKQG